MSKAQLRVQRLANLLIDAPHVSGHFVRSDHQVINNLLVAHCGGKPHHVNLKPIKSESVFIGIPVLDVGLDAFRGYHYVIVQKRGQKARLQLVSQVRSLIQPLDASESLRALCT